MEWITKTTYQVNKADGSIEFLETEINKNLFVYRIRKYISI